MFRDSSRRDLTRRQLLSAGLTATGAMALARVTGASSVRFAPTALEQPYGPFKMGLQSYSLRGYTVDNHADVKKALAVTKGLGLRFWEAFPAHLPITDNADAIKEMKATLQEYGVQVNGFGVVHVGKDEAADRKIFEFAKAMGISYLSVDPDPTGFALLDKLVEEYDIPIGIHNHGPGHRYALIDTIAEAIKDHSPKIGCCIDAGHFLRSKEDPVRAAEVFDKRIYGVHLKDVKNAETFTILGEGDLRTVDLLKVLAKNGYKHCLALEYEEKPEDPVEDIKACLAATRKAVAAMGDA